MQELTTLPFNSNGRGVINPEAHIVSLVLYEMGTYQQQWRRPFHTQSINGDLINQFQEQVGGSYNYKAAAFGGIAQSFLKPAADTEAPVNIVGGWQQRHYRFIMTVEYNAAVGTRMQEILTGYCENAMGAQGANGISTADQMGNINVDPYLHFIVNSTIQVRRQTMFGPSGRQETLAVADNSHLLVDNQFGDMYSSPATERMRPQDIFATMTTGPLRRAAATDQFGNRERVWDQRTAVNNRPVKSRRSNVIPANYVGRIIDNYNNAVINNQEVTAGGQDLYQAARHFSQDGLVNRDEVLRMLSEIRGEPIGNTFQYKDLERLDPTIRGRVLGRVTGQTTRQMMAHEAGQTHEWGGSDGITLASVIISQCVPGIMADLALTRAHFKTHNLFAASGQYSQFNAQTHLSNPDNLPEFVWLYNRGFGNQDLSESLRIFELRFWHEVMKDLSYSNQIPFSLEVNADLAGETVLTISLDGKPQRQYVTPSFADAMLTPLVTGNMELPGKVAEDFNMLMTELVHHRDDLNTSALSPTGGRAKF
jgi:hypothetical protein